MRYCLLFMLVIALVAAGSCTGLTPMEQSTLTGGAGGPLEMVHPDVLN
jgi:hypothetical protein